MMSLGVVRAAGAWLLVLTLLLVSVSCQTARTQHAAAQAAGQGVAWLLAHQNPDGSWGGESDVGRPDQVYAAGNIRSTCQVLIQAGSALAGQALIVPARQGDAKALAALEAALAWQLAHPSERRSAPSAFYNVWGSSYRLEFFMALAESGLFAQRRPAVLAAAKGDLDRLLEIQAANGGFAYYDMDAPMSPATGSETTSFCSAVALHAMLHARRLGLEVPQGRVQGAAAAIRYCRLSDSAFSYGPASASVHNPASMPYGAAGRTCLCHLALAELGDQGSAAALAPALSAYQQYHGAIMAGAGRTVPHQAPGGIAGYYVWFSHYYAMQTALRLQDEAAAGWVARKVIDHQGSAGYWFDFPIPGVGRTYATAFAVLALQDYATLRQP